MSSQSVFADKKEHLIISQPFSEVRLAEDNPLAASCFALHSHSKVLWVLETSGPLDKGFVAASQEKERARTTAAPSCNGLSHFHAGEAWRPVGHQNLH